MWISRYERLWNARLDRLEEFFAAKNEINMKLIDITVTRVIPAPAEDVFDVWIDPKSPGEPWFGIERTILQPVIDGLSILQ